MHIDREAVTPRYCGGVPEAVAHDRGSGEDGAGRRADAAGNHATCVMASHADRREARSQKAARPIAAMTSRQETGAPGRALRSQAEGDGDMTSSQNAALYEPWGALWNGDLSLTDKIIAEDSPATWPR